MARQLLVAIKQLARSRWWIPVAAICAGCSSTIVVRTPFQVVPRGAPAVGEHCWSTEDCESGTCSDGYCVSATSRQPTALEMLNEKVREKAADVLLDHGEQVRVTNLRVGAETALWTEDEQTRRVPLEAIQNIHLVERGRGGAEGLGLGILAGLAAGTATGLIVGAGEDFRLCGTGDLKPGEQCAMAPAIYAMFFAIAGAIIGAPLGTLVGVGVGHRTTFELEAPRHSP